MDLKTKLMSRKFWLGVAAFLGSIGTSIAGITTNNSAVTIAGLICSVVSVAIYSGCEAYVDAAAVPLVEYEDGETAEEEEE